MTVHELHSKLTEFSRLTENWDSYGGRTITQAALEAARQAVDSASPTPDWISPTSRGGVQLEWFSNVRDVEIEFLPNGQPAILVTPKLNGACLWDECIEWSSGN